MPVSFDPNSVPVYEGSSGVGGNGISRQSFIQYKTSFGPPDPNWIEGGYSIVPVQQGD